MQFAQHALAQRPIAGLYALTPDLADTEALTETVSAALAGGASAIQYRNKTASPELRLVQALALRELCATRGATFIVNDHIELAHTVDADGVHVGRDDATIAAARARLKPTALVGVSCYDSLERAQIAVAAGADYVAFGSFFASTMKPDAVRVDVSVLSIAKARWGIPVVAIGGITAANATMLLSAGADAVAVINALFGAVDVRAAAESIARLFTRRR